MAHRTPTLRGNPNLNPDLNSTQICKNKVDESFRHVQAKIKLFAKNFLLQHLRSRAPQKAESEVKATMKKHTHTHTHILSSISIPFPAASASACRNFACIPQLHGHRDKRLSNCDGCKPDRKQPRRCSSARSEKLLRKWRLRLDLPAA